MDSKPEVVRRAPLILAAAIGVACSATALPFYSIGPLTKPLTEAHGWSRSEVQTAILFSVGLGALMSPLVGALVQKYGARRVAMPGLVGLALSFFLASISGSSILIFYLAFAGMAVLGAGSSPVSWTRGIASSFSRQRGFALGLVLTGTGLCAIVIPQLVTAMIAWGGVDFALIGLGMLPLAIALPLAWWLFRPDETPPANEAGAPDEASWGISLGEALRGYRFWVIFASIACIYLAQSGIVANLIPAVTDTGVSAQAAANVQSVLGVSIVVGRIAVGYLIDRIWAPGVAAIVTFLPVFACLMLPGSDDYFVIMACAVIIGIAAGAELDLLAFLSARYFGLAHYARIYSMFYAALAVAGGVAPFLFAAIYDRFGSYAPAFQVGAGLFAVGSLILLTLGRYPQGAGRQPE
ncbi:MFS transporter [Sphingomonas sp. AOB5]|uniref:MFS transporter n=1 Tax=Sphingomonas sp. AOB5 TaxID=3034017 RepID=UPI0023F9AE22|nr:MFS transporter [Sphingomonas sp. AOB5]MDF7774808.1 MFS transporter [Sphingomonas sp. AOB5]